MSSSEKIATQLLGRGPRVSHVIHMRPRGVRRWGYPKPPIVLRRKSVLYVLLAGGCLIVLSSLSLLTYWNSLTDTWRSLELPFTSFTGVDHIGGPAYTCQKHEVLNQAAKFEAGLKQRYFFGYKLGCAEVVRLGEYLAATWIPIPQNLTLVNIGANKGITDKKSPDRTRMQCA